MRLTVANSVPKMRLRWVSLSQLLTSESGLSRWASGVGLKTMLPDAVVGDAERRIRLGLVEQPVVASDVLQAADVERRAADAEAILRLAFDADAHLLAAVRLREHDADLLLDLAAHGVLGAIVAALDAEPVLHERAIAGDEVLPVGVGAVLHRRDLLGVEGDGVTLGADRLRDDRRRAALVEAGGAVGLALVVRVLLGTEHLDLAGDLLLARVGVVGDPGVAGLAAAGRDRAPRRSRRAIRRSPWRWRP